MSKNYFKLESWEPQSKSKYIDLQLPDVDESRKILKELCESEDALSQSQARFTQLGKKWPQGVYGLIGRDATQSQERLKHLLNSTSRITNMSPTHPIALKGWQTPSSLQGLLKTTSKSIASRLKRLLTQINKNDAR